MNTDLNKPRQELGLAKLCHSSTRQRQHAAEGTPVQTASARPEQCWDLGLESCNTRYGQQRDTRAQSSANLKPLGEGCSKGFLGGGVP